MGLMWVLVLLVAKMWDMVLMWVGFCWVWLVWLMMVVVSVGGMMLGLVFVVLMSLVGV